MRIASYNVQNLFARARALSMGTWAAGRPVLEAHAQINELFERSTYTDATKRRILALLDELGLLHSDTSQFARLQVIRGRLLRRPRNGDVEVVASGRADWIGWVELTKAPIDDLAISHTAMVVRDVAADVLGIVEVEDRATLARFSDSLVDVGGVPYDQALLLDGNDDRGIDVGILLGGGFTLEHLRTHMYDRDDEGIVFSRDCPEYHLRTTSGEQVVVLVNHFKSKGYSEPGDRLGNGRRRRQAARVAEIYSGLGASGVDAVAVVGDLNDTPDSEPLAPLLQDTDLRDISTHATFDFGPRRGTVPRQQRARQARLRAALTVALGPRHRRRRVPQRCVARPTHRRPVGALSDADCRGARGERPCAHLRRPRPRMTGGEGVHEGERSSGTPRRRPVRLGRSADPTGCGRRPLVELARQPPVVERNAYTSSMRAISALSPWRAPSLRMRM